MSSLLQDDGIEYVISVWKLRFQGARAKMSKDDDDDDDDYNAHTLLTPISLSLAWPHPHLPLPLSNARSHFAWARGRNAGMSIPHHTLRWRSLAAAAHFERSIHAEAFFTESMSSILNFNWWFLRSKPAMNCSCLSDALL